MAEPNSDELQPPGQLGPKPSEKTILVNLGFAIARVKHEYFVKGQYPNVGWRRTTTLELLAPASPGESVGNAAIGPAPATYATTYGMDEEQVAELLRALDSAEPT